MGIWIRFMLQGILIRKVETMKPILEMTPKAGEPLKEWLATALMRYALGGVSIGEICDSWMQFLPVLPEQEKEPETVEMQIPKIF